MKYNILFGGKAGQGPNFLTNLLGRALIGKGFYVFFSRDYQSLIRGGHNFNVLTFSEKPVYSNESKIDLIVALDENTLKIHSKELKKGEKVITGKENNAFFAGRLFKALGLDFKELEKQLKLENNFKENIKESKKGFESQEVSLKIPSISKKNFNFRNGTQGISEGAIKSGLDVYYAYPMTPATPLLGELASKQKKENILVLELENEIGIINAGVGSAMTGTKTMIGTSGGGFDLMSESLSLLGIAEIPLVIYLAQRAGPGTGVATYTAQGDLNIARHAGHGEFNRVVLAPGTPLEAEELANQAFYLSQKFKIPSIILSDKHLAESNYCFSEKAKISKVPKNTEFKKYHSYEKLEDGTSTEDAALVKKNVDKRLQVRKNIEKEAKKFSMYEIHGKKNSKNLIISWGSTKGAILDAIQGLNCGFLHVKYIEPFPEIQKILKGKNLILLENNATGQLGNLIREKTGIEIKNRILRYDARPFLSDELNEEIKKRLNLK
jgi:2-oxoglutarate/2-oxoacid ferredoxin oxidoreductase subunit alpha